MNKLPEYELSPGFFADPEYVPTLKEMGLTTLDGIFAFEGGTDLAKKQLSSHRSRTCFRLGQDGPMVYLKRYSRPPAGRQIHNWIEHRRRCCTSVYDGHLTALLDDAGVSTPKTIAYGFEWDGLFEKRSFILIQEIAGGTSLEKKLPDSMLDFSPAVSQARKHFIVHVADFVRRFHATGCRHRDLYLCHLFLDKNNTLYMIDLQRVFKPLLLSERFRIKDLAQLYYSAPGRSVSRADRLRFFLHYRQHDRLTPADKRLIRRVIRKARRIAAHDRKKGRPIPFESF
jgi:heptose I phosphotransferase